MAPEISSETLALTIMNNPFPQVHLISESSFRSYLRERAIDIGFDDLEYFEEQGFLYPIVRVIRPKFLCKKITKIENGVAQEYLLPLEKDESYYGEVVKKYEAIGNITNTLKNYHKSGLTIFPSKSNFKPWKDYKDDYEETALAYYHPYQVLLVKNIVPNISMKFSSKFLLENNFDPEKFQQYFESIKKHFKNQFNSLQDAQKTQRLIHLLLLIQDRYLPNIRGRFIGDFGTNMDEFMGKWFDWKEHFNCQTVLKSTGYSIDELKNLRTSLAAQARFSDPVSDWFMLVRHIHYSKKERLKGKALLAQDYYELVDMLGRFLFELTGEKQLDADDLLDGRQGRWKKHLYGQEVDYKSRDVLRKILNTYGINPQDKLLLILEGPTENEAVPSIIGAMGYDFDGLGIRIMPLGGVGEATPERCEKLLEYLALSPSLAVPYVILDNDQDVKKTLEKYKSKLVNPHNYRIWDTEFEQDNFTEDEIIAGVRMQAQKRGFNIEISKALIEAERQSKRDLGKPIPYITKLLEKLTQPYKIVKPELGKDLGEMVAQRIRKQKEEGNYEPITEIEKEIVKIVKLSLTL